MRLAALYDVHGNLPALEAALADADAAGAELLLFGGDVVSGPMPAETVELLMSLGPRARFVRGNGDREVVERFDALQAGDAAPDEDEWSRRTTWVAEQLTDAHRSFLAGFCKHESVSVDGLGRVLFCHGSPRSDEEIVTLATPEDRLGAMLDGVPERVVVLGHTHMQFDRVVGSTRVVNAGSVGMPYEREPGAYWALLGPDVELRRTQYDVEAAAARLRASAFPGAEEFARENVLTTPTPQEATELFERIAEERASPA